MNQINEKSITRAQKTIKCLAFNLKFYKDAQIFGISSEKVFQMKNKYISKIYRSHFKGPDKIENDFRWLITTGILRREVDGQGLTSRVRLTPLGRQIIELYPELANQKALLIERILQKLFRKIRFQ
tara:strand:- start:2433 stop:2810 length:378 start_codon:yes stop_codon:yes gene_type:complete